MPAQQNIDTGRCLAPKDFADLDAGNLTDPELVLVLDHLSSCTRCETLLQDWKGSTEDELSEKVRKCFLLEPIRRDSALSLIEAAALDQTGPILQDRSTIISETASLSQSLLGARIGQYQIVEEIGRGGMGLVFRALHEKLNRYVAIKIIRAGFYADSNAIARFRTEAGAIARLTHANVARIYDYSEQNDSLPYFVMELIDGGSLEKKLSRGPLPYRQAAELTQVVARAVEDAHQKQVIHRDLKPSNILMTRDGIPKIADFGLAKMLDEQQSNTQTDMILGTPSYMAPEQAVGHKGRVGPRTDVYALGAILYETMTGQPPFKGSDRLDTLRLVCEQELTPPSRLRRDIPRDLEAICIKSLTKSPSRRYQSAQAFADDLGLWLDHQRPKGIPGVFGRGMTKLRRNWIAASLVVFCLILAVALYLRDPDRPLREMQSRLANGEPATMIDVNGKPTWYRWLEGKETSTIAPVKDGALQLNASDIAMLELLPAVECDHYRFQIRVRHEKSNMPGDVGIYFARQTFLEGEVPIHFFMQLSFNDIRGKRDMPILIGKRPIPEMTNVAHLFPRLHSIEGMPPHIDSAMVGRSGPAFEPPGEGSTGWRDLAVTVSPKGVTAEWEGQTFYLSADEIRTTISRNMAQLVKTHSQKDIFAKLTPDYSPRGGLGLFIYRGSASISSATVIPQQAPNP